MKKNKNVYLMNYYGVTPIEKFIMVEEIDKILFYSKVYKKIAEDKLHNGYAIYFKQEDGKVKIFINFGIDIQNNIDLQEVGTINNDNIIYIKNDKIINLLYKKNKLNFID